MAMESTLKSPSSTAETSSGKDSSYDHYTERLAYNTCISELRETEYPMLKDQIYLDHAATTIPSASLLAAFAKDITGTLYGNPHSLGSSSSQTSSACCDNVRLKVLRLFNADPAAFDVVFVANATAGIKLVAETMACQKGGFRYWYHRDAHTSLAGVREVARQSVCMEDDAAVEEWIRLEAEQENDDERNHGLFAYPAQSNMDGRRLPLSWCRGIGSVPRRVYTLLDAAALVSTSPLDLSSAQSAPDFTVMSFYKMFGFPDLGALIVKKDVGSIFRARRYFGGGTVETVACGENQEWHFKKDTTLHESLEDGTLPICSIRALDLAIDNHERLFGSFKAISQHTSFLSHVARVQLEDLRHANGLPVCKFYGERDSVSTRGSVIALNFLDASGNCVSLQEVQKLANVHNIHLRTGNLCNPGGVSRALCMDAKDLMENYSAGLRCSSDRDILNGKPTGVVRLSFGAMSTLDDVNQLLLFVKDSLVEDALVENEDSMAMDNNVDTDFYISSLVVYPIKSCGGYSIPRNTPWMIRSEGLAWDREWCLIHQGTQAALNQKRYSKLALFKPTLDVQQGLLHVQWTGPPSRGVPNTISILLSFEERLFRQTSASSCPQMGCNEQAQPLTYKAPEINNFFSTHLDVPVYLARLPRKGSLSSSRGKETHVYSTKSGGHLQDMPGSFPTPPPSPPQSHSANELETIPASTSLANESPILVLFMSSLNRVNALLPPDMAHISSDSFRGNIILDTRNVSAARTNSIPESTPLKLVEDTLTTLEIQNNSADDPDSSFKLDLMAPCRRCQMVAIDQTTAIRRPEIFAHMAKVRRWNGGVWFGVHAMINAKSRDKQDPGSMVCVGDKLRAR